MRSQARILLAATFSILLLVAATLAAHAGSGKDPGTRSPSSSSEPDSHTTAASFRVGGKSDRVLDGRLTAGVCDYPNASLGIWRAYGRTRNLSRGLVRTRSLFLQQKNLPRIIESGLEAQRAGFDILLMVHAAPEHFEGWLADAERYEETYNKLPNDFNVWARRAAEVCKEVIAAGVPVTHVEIWGEPERRNSKDGPEKFAKFFAIATKTLKRELPSEIKVGGPGMAGAFAHGFDFFRALLRECKSKSTAPDFLSWHQYEGWATDTAAFNIDERLQKMANNIIGKDVELILGEWSLALPSPGHPKPQLDDHRNAVHWLATISSLATETTVAAQCYFMLQDGTWEAKQDYQGQGPGMFTVHGGPKAIVVGQRMMDIATQLPMLELERDGAPWNIAALATGEGDRRFVLLSNSIRIDEGRVKKSLDQQGVAFHKLPKSQRNNVYGYVSGRVPYSKLNQPSSDEPKWERAREVLKRTRKAAKKAVPVEVAMDRPIGRLVNAWAIGEGSGNPAEDDNVIRTLRRMVEKRRNLTPAQKRALKENPDQAWDKEAAALTQMLDSTGCQPPQLEDPNSIASFGGNTLSVTLEVNSAVLIELEVQ